MSHNLRKFTHVEACCVAFELGARDADRDSTRLAIGINCAALQGGCPAAGHGAESRFRESSEKIRHVLTSDDAVLRSNVLSEMVIVTAPL